MSVLLAGVRRTALTKLLVDERQPSNDQMGAQLACQTPRPSQQSGNGRQLVGDRLHPCPACWKRDLGTLWTFGMRLGIVSGQLRLDEGSRWQCRTSCRSARDEQRSYNCWCSSVSSAIARLSASFTKPGFLIEDWGGMDEHTGHRSVSQLAARRSPGCPQHRHMVIRVLGN